MSRPVAVITGASSGIGSVFARKLAARGYDLLLIARRKSNLVQLARDLPGSHDTFACDLSTAEGLDAAADRVASQPDLELLVNNAGFGTKGRFWETPFEDQRRMHRLHVDATLVLTHAVLPGMVARDRGRNYQRFVRGLLRAQSGKCELLRHQVLDECLHRGNTPRTT